MKKLEINQQINKQNKETNKKPGKCLAEIKNVVIYKAKMNVPCHAHKL